MSVFVIFLLNRLVLEKFVWVYCQRGCKKFPFKVLSFLELRTFRFWCAKFVLLQHVCYNLILLEVHFCFGYTSYEEKK